jgi:organic hydroperoxide reductase OsmC/OhrA
MADVFSSHLEWSGAEDGPTLDSATYSRDLTLSIEANRLPMSAAPEYRGDPSRANPEQLLVAALSSCQALTYLFLAAKNGIAVVSYSDDAEGWLEVLDGKMRMSRVALRPHIVIDVGASETKARELVETAHRSCFIASSVSARVEIDPSFDFAQAPMAAR